MAEAARHRDFPLDNPLATRLVTPWPNVTVGWIVFTFSGGLTPQLLASYSAGG